MLTLATVHVPVTPPIVVAAGLSVLAAGTAALAERRAKLAAADFTVLGDTAAHLALVEAHLPVPAAGSILVELAVALASGLGNLGSSQIPLFV